MLIGAIRGYINTAGIFSLVGIFCFRRFPLGNSAEHGGVA
jgi:hypothetical protein